MERSLSQHVQTRAGCHFIHCVLAWLLKEEGMSFGFCWLVACLGHDDFCSFLLCVFLFLLSLLSHSAVVARELGLPTIVGVSNLMKNLKVGDGDHGNCVGVLGSLTMLYVSLLLFASLLEAEPCVQKIALSCLVAGKSIIPA